MKFKDYLKIYNEIIKEGDNIKFWGITLLTVDSGMKIQMWNGHYLTISDCFMEMGGRLTGYKFEGGWVRAWWEQFQYLRGLIDKPYWM